MVKGDYKTTELGHVPADWEVLPLKGNFDFFQNNTYARDCLNPSKGSIHNIHYGDVLIKFGSILDCDKELIPYINPDIPVNIVKRLVQSGDIIIADTAEDNTVGKATEVINVGDKMVVSGLHTVFIRPHARLFAERFLGYLINSSVYHDQLLPFIVGTKVSSVSKGSLQQTFVLQPPLPEQRRIAAALSDMDSYIAALEKLIAKKRSIKQALLQQMFPKEGSDRPEIRLPGFTDAWEQRQLGEVGETQSGIGFPENEQGGTNGIPFFKVSDMNNLGNEYEMNNSNNYISNTQMQRRKWQPIKVPAVIFAKVGAAIMLNRKRIVRTPFLIDNNTMAYIFDSSWDVNFGKALFETIYLPQYIQVGALPSYNGSDINVIDCAFPSLSEQVKIGELFSTFDDLLTLHQRELEKARNIKQGMMQELLTGRIRLVDEKIADVPVEKPIAKAVETPKAEPKGHNQQFDDAVAISAIVNAFYNPQYALGRVKVQKLLYLYRRHQAESTAEFQKKAAGPYDEQVRYKGGEPIALKNGYILQQKGKQGTTFAVGKNIDKALGYISDWGTANTIRWLKDNFRYKTRDELELLATVDMAICEIEESGAVATLAAIKALIAKDKEWRAKLNKPIFSDANITRTMGELQTLLPRRKS